MTLLAVTALVFSSCRDGNDCGLCMISSEETVSVNGSRTFPMHSVVKFPQALYVADYLSRNGVSPDSAVVVRKADLMQDTWSPMLEMMDTEKEFSFIELLKLSLAASDNNACDLLFELCGMPQDVDSFIKGLGFKDIDISVTERQMHGNISLASLNSCTPGEMSRLLLWFHEHKDDNSYYQGIWDIMASCETGADRIPAAFGSDCRIMHKTGTGFAPEGVLPPMNDAGIVIRPDGRVLAVSVFIPHPVSASELSETVKKNLEHFL